MGRAYKVEMDELPTTVSAALDKNLNDSDVDEFRGVVAHPLVAVGVGGSMTAAHFAARPSRGRLRTVRALGLATAATTVSGTCGALGAVFHAIPDRFAGKPDWPLVLLTGLGEAMSAGILGFAFVALMALVASLGTGRLAE